MRSSARADILRRTKPFATAEEALLAVTNGSMRKGGWVNQVYDVDPISKHQKEIVFY